MTANMTATYLFESFIIFLLFTRSLIEQTHQNYGKTFDLASCTCLLSPSNGGQPVPFSKPDRTDSGRLARDNRGVQFYAVIMTRGIFRQYSHVFPATFTCPFLFQVGKTEQPYTGMILDLCKSSVK